MLVRSGLIAALALALSLPATASVRPVPRPFAVEPAAEAPALRPRANPAYMTAADTALRVEVPLMSIGAITALVSRALVEAAPRQGAMPVDPPLLAAAARAQRYEVVTSSANALPAPAPALRPRPRPAAQAVAAPAPAVLRPMPRPFAAAAPAQPQPEAAVLRAVAGPALRPEPRPRGLSQRRAPEAEVVLAAAVLPPEPGKPLVRGKKGSVCGDPTIRGESIPPIPARLKGCGLEEPVRVTEIDGIRLSTPATVSCDTARAMKSWINAGLRPAFGRRNPPVALNIAASYVCRPRNNVPGNPVSEHGRGKAVDISAIVLKSGEVVDVQQDYRRSKALRAAHRAGCGPFGTTLGPGSDGYHEDHLHFDIANRNRPYCR